MDERLVLTQFRDNNVWRDDNGNQWVRLVESVAMQAYAWDQGQGAGVVAAVNFTPLEPNPYR